MILPYENGALVWVKLEGYPWWPCQVYTEGADTPAPAETENPLPIIYLGSGEFGYINGLDTNQCVPFEGGGARSEDADKCAECASDPTLAVALETALAQLNANTAPIADGGNASGALEGESSSSDDEDGEKGDDDLLNYGGTDYPDASAPAGETEEERRLRRKKEKKEKKSKKDKKDKKKDKSDKKKDKKSRREDDDAEAKREKRHRSEKEQPSSSSKHQKSSAKKSRKHDDDDENDFGYGGDDGRYDEDDRPIVFDRFDVDDATILQIKQQLDNAIDESDAGRVRDCLSDLTKINVTFEQLLSTEVGQSVGRVCDVTANKRWGAAFAPLQTWAEAIIRFWFAQIPDRHKNQLIDAGEVDRASLASNEDAQSQHSEKDDYEQLDALGLEIERAFADSDELNKASAILTAADLALELQVEIESLGTENKAQRGVEVLQTLRRPDHAELRMALLRGELTVKDFVHDPVHSGMTRAEKRELEAQELEAGKAMDITGEKERIEHAIATAEVVEK